MTARWGMRARTSLARCGTGPSWMKPSHARAQLERDGRRHQRKGKMLLDRGRIHGFRDRKIAAEHGHHRFDFEQRQGAPWTHPWPAPKGHQGWGLAATPGLQGRGQPAFGLKLRRRRETRARAGRRVASGERRRCLPAGGYRRDPRAAWVRKTAGAPPTSAAWSPAPPRRHSAAVPASEHPAASGPHRARHRPPAAWHAAPPGRRS